MVRFGKKAALLAMAGVLTAASVTGCSGAIDAEATVVTVGKEKVPLGVVNFYARMMQGQYETYYAGQLQKNCGRRMREMTRRMKSQ